MLYENKITLPEKRKVIEVSERLGIEPDWLMLVMNSESGINPAKYNSLGCVGLIQFCPDEARGNVKTIEGKKVLLSDLAKMSMIEQLEYVYLYFSRKKYTFKSFHDLYLYTFFPIAVGKPDDWIFQADTISASSVFRQNPAIAKFSNLQDKINISAFKKYTENELIKSGFQLPGKKELETADVIVNTVKKNKYALYVVTTVIALVGVFLIFKRD